jgi:hypothetical protein
LLGPSASRAAVGDWRLGWSVDGGADDGDHGAEREEILGHLSLMAEETGSARIGDPRAERAEPCTTQCCGRLQFCLKK